MSEDAPRIATTSGTFIGRRGDGCDVFLGIPYAESPSGARRFAPPAPALRHPEPRMAVEYGPRCPQLDSMLENFLGGGSVPTDEAGCLNLNVWAPSEVRGARPIMVFVHGGAYLWGSSSSPWYDGTAFARDHGVVLVSVNYRLGVLGFSHLAELGDGLGATSSLGVQDVAVALRWVVDNAPALGGDPDNVTVFGESAGAMAIGTLLGMPAARGLFRRAIFQSGSASTFLERDVAAARTRELLEELGRPGADVAALRQTNLEDLLAATARVASRRGDELLFAPVVDGEVVARPPLEAVRAGEVRGHEFVIGTNRDEWRLFSLADPTFAATSESDLVQLVERYLPGRAEEVVALYRSRRGDVAPAEVRVALATDAVFRIPAIRLAEAHAAAGGTVFMYLFDFASTQAGGLLGSCHGLELPFVFNTLHQPGAVTFTGDNPPRSLARELNATWARFASTGDPGGPMGEWPRYEATARLTKIISVDASVESDPMGEERAVFSSL